MPSEETPNPHWDMNLLRSDLFWEPKKNFFSTVPLSEVWAASTKQVPSAFLWHFTEPCWTQPSSLFPTATAWEPLSCSLCDKIYSGFNPTLSRCCKVCIFMTYQTIEPESMGRYQKGQTIENSVPFLSVPLLNGFSSSTNLLLRTSFKNHYFPIQC